MNCIAKKEFILNVRHNALQTYASDLDSDVQNVTKIRNSEIERSRDWPMPLDRIFRKTLFCRVHAWEPICGWKSWMNGAAKRLNVCVTLCNRHTCECALSTIFINIFFYVIICFNASKISGSASRSLISRPSRNSSIIIDHCNFPPREKKNKARLISGLQTRESSWNFENPTVYYYMSPTRRGKNDPTRLTLFFFIASRRHSHVSTFLATERDFILMTSRNRRSSCSFVSADNNERWIFHEVK